MKVILTEPLEHVGGAGEIVDVKPGYARNFLLPRKLALVASHSNMAVFQEVQSQKGAQAARDKREAEERAEALGKASITIAVAVGEEDRIFGSVTNQQIAELLNEQDFEIDRRTIQLDEPIRALGVYDVPIKLHPEVEATVKVWVVKE
jgi:large subunit ribosomal protein L9